MRIKILLFLLIFTRLCFAQSPELVIQNGHSSGALLMDISFDGRYLISSGADINSLIGNEFSNLPFDFFKKTDEQNGLIIYDCYSGKILRYCQNSKGGIFSIASSKKEYIFATGDYFGNISIFNLDGNIKFNFCKVRENTLPYCIVNYIRFFNNSNALVAAYSDSTIIIWKLGDQKIQKNFKINSNVKLLDVSDDDSLIVFACENGSLGIIELRNDKITMFDTTEGEIVTIGLRGKYLYILKESSIQNELQIWNVDNLKQEKKFIINGPILTKGKFTNDCKKLFASKWSGGVVEIDCNTGVILNENISEINDFIYSITISQDDKICYFSQPYSKIISFYDVNRRAIVKKITYNYSWIISLNFLPDSKTFITAAGQSVFWWDLVYCKVQNSIRFQSEIYSTTVSKNGKVLSVGTSSGDFFLVNNNDKSYQKFNFSESAIYAMDFSYDNNKLAFVSDKVYIFDINSKQLFNSFFETTNTIKTIRFIPNTDYVLIGGFDRCAKIYDYNKGILIKELKEIDGIVMTSDVNDNNLIAVYSAGKGIFIYNSSDFDLYKFISFNTSLITNLKLYKDKIFVSDWNGDIYSIEISRGSFEKLFRHNATVLKIDISTDNRFLISGGTDGCIKVWDINSNIELATLISVDSNDCLTLIPENYYIVSKNGYKAIAFRIGNKAYPFEQFDLIYNRPDLVYKRIGILSEDEIEMYKNAYKKRLQKSGFQNLEIQDKYDIPEVMILNKNIETVINDDIFNLEFAASSNNCSLKDAYISVNKIPYKKISISNDKNKFSTYRVTIPIEISTGRNKIEVSCINEMGIESLKEVIEIMSTKEKKPNLFIIAVGVSNYLDKSRKLNYASKDAIDFAELFEVKQSDGRFSQVKIITLIDSQVTKEDFLSLKKEVRVLDVNDIVIAFFAGHGMLDRNGGFYFGTYDINFENPERQGINYDDIESLFASSKARKKLLLVDACHSGDLDEEEYKNFYNLKYNSDTLKSNLVLNSSFRGDEITFENVNQEKSKSLYEFMKELFNDISKSTGTIVISATSGLSYAYESSELKNGAFTYSIIRGLKFLESDLNKDGKILVSELKEYIIETVKKITNNGQKPTVKKENLENDFQIW